jgi:hypothetical protein
LPFLSKYFNYPLNISPILSPAIYVAFITCDFEINGSFSFYYNYDEVSDYGNGISIGFVLTGP